MTVADLYNEQIDECEKWEPGMIAPGRSFKRVPAFSVLRQTMTKKLVCWHKVHGWRRFFRKQTTASECTSCAGTSLVAIPWKEVMST